MVADNYQVISLGKSEAAAQRGFIICSEKSTDGLLFDTARLLLLDNFRFSAEFLKVMAVRCYVKGKQDMFVLTSHHIKGQYI